MKARGLALTGLITLLSTLHFDFPLSITPFASSFLLREYSDRDATICSSGVNLSRTFDNLSVQTNKSQTSKNRLNRRTNRWTNLDEFYVQYFVVPIFTLRRLVRPDDLSVSDVKTACLNCRKMIYFCCLEEKKSKRLSKIRWSANNTEVNLLEIASM